MASSLISDKPSKSGQIKQKGMSKLSQTLEQIFDSGKVFLHGMRFVNVRSILRLGKFIEFIRLEIAMAITRIIRTIT